MATCELIRSNNPLNRKSIAPISCPVERVSSSAVHILVGYPEVIARSGSPGMTSEFVVTVLGFRYFSFPSVVFSALPHSSGAPQPHTFAQLNLRSALVRRDQGRLPSHGFIERAPEHRAHANFFPESAPPINL
jgi:hypothetical protein